MLLTWSTITSRESKLSVDVATYKLELDDWEDLRELYLQFSASPHYAKLDLNLKTMQSYFLISQSNPKYAVLGLRAGPTLVGFCVVYEIVVPGVADSHGRIALVPKSFIMGLYITPNTPRKYARKFSEAIDAWALSQGHLEILGNCRPGLPLNAAGLYGYREKYKVMAKSLATNISDVSGEEA